MNWKNSLVACAAFALLVAGTAGASRAPGAGRRSDGAAAARATGPASFGQTLRAERRWRDVRRAATDIGEFRSLGVGGARA